MVFNVPAAHKPGVFTLRSVEIDGGAVEHQLNGTILRVPLPRPLPPDESITLNLDFVVRVPELIDPQSAEANLSYTSDALMAGYWYPLVAPYRSAVGCETPWYPIGDPFVSESANYTAIITATPGVMIIAGGDLTRDRNVWRYDLPRARTFGFIAGPYYRTLLLTSGEKTYAISVLPRHLSLGPVALQTLIKAERLFTALYSSYPYQSLRVAEFSGPWSMEFAGFFVLGATEFDDYDGTQRNRLIASWRMRLHTSGGMARWVMIKYASRGWTRDWPASTKCVTTKPSRRVMSRGGGIPSSVQRGHLSRSTRQARPLRITATIWTHLRSRGALPRYFACAVRRNDLQRFSARSLSTRRVSTDHHGRFLQDSERSHALQRTSPERPLLPLNA